MKAGSESIETIIPRKRILFVGFMARMKNETTEVRDVRRNGGGRGLRGGTGARVDGESLGRSQSFRINADQLMTGAQEEEG